MPVKKVAEDEQSQRTAEAYRELLSNAYAFVEGQKLIQTTSALTPEDLYDRFIERISGKDTQSRPNVLNRIEKLKNDMIASIEKIKAINPEDFRQPDAGQDVNTPIYTIEVVESAG